MAKLAWAAIVLASLAWGCGPKATVIGANGEKVTTDGAGNVSVTNEKGDKVDISTSGETTTARSSKGDEVKWDGKGMTGKTAKGETFSMGKAEVTEAELGVPFYPGSSPSEGRDVEVDSNGKKSFVSYRTTKDAPDKVLAFYKDKLIEPSTTTMEKMAMAEGKLDGNRKFTLSAMTRDDGTTEIQVSVVDQ